jgi:hypothetical protein
MKLTEWKEDWNQNAHAHDANYLVLRTYESGRTELVTAESLREPASDLENAESGLSELFRVTVFTRLR